MFEKREKKVIINIKSTDVCFGIAIKNQEHKSFSCCDNMQAFTLC